MTDAINQKQNIDRPPARKASQPGACLIGYKGRDNCDQRQYKDEMAHTVEKDALDHDCKGDWEGDAQPHDEIYQNWFAIKLGPLAQNNGAGKNRSAQQKNQDEFGKG